MNKEKIIVNGRAPRDRAVNRFQNKPPVFTRPISNSKIELLLMSFLLVPLLITTIFGQETNANANQNTNKTANQQPVAVNSNTPAATVLTSETSNKNLTDRDKSKKTDWHSDVVVKEVYNIQYRELKNNDRREAGLNDIITVVVNNLEELLKRSKCDKEFEDPKIICRPKDIVLYINGREIKGLQPESGAPSLFTEMVPGESQQPGAAVNGELRYHLQRINDAPESNRDNSEHWSDLLGLRLDNFSGSPNYSFEKLRKRQVEVSVGLSDDYPVRTDVRVDAKTDDQKFWLIRLRGGYWFGLWFVIMLAVIAGLVYLAMNSDLLKDRAAVLYNQKKPYSLSAFQAAWWFAIVLLSFIFIWLVTGQNDFSPTALILLGIGLGTTLGANIIDVNKRGASSNPQIGAENLKILLSEKEKFEKELNELPLNSTARNAKNQEYQGKILEIRRSFPNAIGPPTKGFFHDIVSDINGVSFHRFQLFVWTIILGLFFIISALGRLAMPQFNETLLALLGISAGAFLGFKGPENNNAAIPMSVQNNGNGNDDTPPNDQSPGNQNAAMPSGQENVPPLAEEQSNNQTGSADSLSKNDRIKRHDFDAA